MYNALQINVEVSNNFLIFLLCSLRALVMTPAQLRYVDNTASFNATSFNLFHPLGRKV
jgi:hypothetical protein